MNKREKKSLYSFSLASFFNDLGSDMIAPIWPIFLTTILGANIALLGLIDGIAVAVVAMSKALAGWWSDRVGKRKPFIAIGYALSSGSRLGYYLSTNPLMVIPFKVMDRFGKIRGAPRDAMIAEMTDKKERGRAFGILRSMDSFGALTGTLVTLLIISFVAIRNIILLAVIPSIISSIIIILFVKESKGRDVFKGFSFKLSPKLKKLLAIMAFFTFFSLTYSFLIVFAKDAGLSNQVTVLMYLLFNIVYTISAFQFGKLSDRFGRIWLLMLGLGFFTLTCITALYFNILLMFIFFGLYISVLDPVQKTVVSDLAPKGRRGGIIGSYQMIIGLTAIPGGLFMGWLYDLSPLYPFITGLVASLTSLLLMLTIKK